MGNCNSVICLKRTTKESEKSKESEEIEETPVVEIHINCPPKQEELPLRRDTRTVAPVSSRSSSVDILDVDSADEQSLSGTPPFLSDGECNSAGLPQDSEEHFSFEVRGKSCLPRNLTVTGLGQQNDFHGCALAPVESPACCSSWKESQLQQQVNGNGKVSNWVKGRPGSSGLHRPRKISLPLPRPSLWQQVYSKTLKKREQLADEKFNRKAQCDAKKGEKADNLDEAIRARSLRLIKKVSKSMRLKADQDPNSSPAALPPDEAIARRFGVDVEDSRDSSSDNSSSCASPRLSSAVSPHSSITSDRDLEETLESVNNGQKGGRKSRKWFKLTRNKVAPL